MQKLLDYEDLKQRRLTSSRTSLDRAIKRYGFPPGRLITPGRRFWTEEEIEEWLASRPAEKRPYGGPKAAPGGETR